MREEYFIPGEDFEHCCCSCGWRIVPQYPGNRTGDWRHEDPDHSCEEGDELESPVYRVEFLRAWDDGSWDTQICEVHPYLTHEKATDEHLVEWANKVLGVQAQYRKVVLWAVYSHSPD